MGLRTFGLWTLVMSLAALGATPARAQPDSSLPPGASQGIPIMEPVVTIGYIIWTDPDGFHVRWTSRVGTRSFSGDVTTDGTIHDLRRVGLERGDVVRRFGNTIVWDALTGAGTDGFDFTLSRPADWVRFSLLIDGRLAPREHIFVGRRGAHPAANPFVLRLGDAVTDRCPPVVRGQPYPQGFGPGSFPAPAYPAGQGYFIWCDNGGWHVRWIGRGWARETSGLISTDGRFHDFRRVQLEEGDLIARDQSLIAWEARTAGGIDGFDFRTTGDRLTFTLLIDGYLAGAGQIFLGAGGAHPQRNPFKITR